MIYYPPKLEGLEKEFSSLDTNAVWVYCPNERHHLEESYLVRFIRFVSSLYTHGLFINDRFTQGYMFKCFVLNAVTPKVVYLTQYEILLKCELSKGLPLLYDLHSYGKYRYCKRVKAPCQCGY